MQPDGGTYYIGSDQYAFEVVGTISPKRKLISLHEGSKVVAISQRRNGRWYEMGQPSAFGEYVFGIAETRLDPNF